MHSGIQKILDYYQREGALKLLRRGLSIIYNRYVRKLSPARRYVKYNGVDVGLQKRWIDVLIRPDEQYIDQPRYKRANISLITEFCEEGDQVIIIGGGHGVTSVVAASLVGCQGFVDVYEASGSKLKILKKTLGINGVDSVCQIHHKIVATRIDTSGLTFSGEVISPDELPECDLIECDCEGAEIEIIRQLEVKPRNIIVETHPRKGAPTEEVISVLTEQGYAIENRQKDPVAGDVLVGSRI